MSAEAFRQTLEQPNERIIIALDNMDWQQAETVMGEVSRFVGLAKANSIAQRLGWQHAVDAVGEKLGAFIMADAKYKDVPSTMENHVRETSACGPQFITVHADNSREALEAAVRGRNQGKEEIEANKALHFKFGSANFPRLGGLLGITVLTSIEDDECVSIYGDKTEKKVQQFAETALEAGLDGIVCSGEELNGIRANDMFDDLLTVVPGITPEWTEKADDQKRIVTPSEAVQRGADYIVVGRAITKPPEGVSRVEAAQRIAIEIEEAL
jgi:orotidine-5'-phosphate decarboxylase